MRAGGTGACGLRASGLLAIGILIIAPEALLLDATRPAVRGIDRMALGRARPRAGTMPSDALTLRTAGRAAGVNPGGPIRGGVPIEAVVLAVVLEPDRAPDLGPGLVPDLVPDLAPDLAPDLGADLALDLALDLVPVLVPVLALWVVLAPLAMFVGAYRSSENLWRH